MNQFEMVKEKCASEIQRMSNGTVFGDEDVKWSP